MSAAPTAGGSKRPALRIVAVALAAAAALCALSGVYVVGAGERGVVTRLGRVVADDVAPGVHYHAPWPIERAGSSRVRVSETAAARVAQGGATGGSRLTFLTGDRNLVEAVVGLSYEATDPAAVLVLARDATLVVRRAAEAAVADAVGRATLDDLLGDGAAAIGSQAAASAQAALDALRSGIRVTAVRLEQLSLAGPAAAAGGRAGDAGGARRRAVQEAQDDRAKTASLAQGEAASLLAAARVDSARVVKRAEEDSARFNALLSEYRNDPTAVRDRLYRETMRDVLLRVRTRVVDSGAPGSGSPPAQPATSSAASADSAATGGEQAARAAPAKGR